MPNVRVQSATNTSPSHVFNCDTYHHSIVRYFTSANSSLPKGSSYGGVSPSTSFFTSWSGSLYAPGSRSSTAMCWLCDAIVHDGSDQSEVLRIEWLFGQSFSKDSVELSRVAVDRPGIRHGVACQHTENTSEKGAHRFRRKGHCSQGLHNKDMAVGPWHASVPPLWGHARIGSGPWALRRDESWINDVTETGREAGEAPTRPPKRLWRRSAASDAGVPAGNAMKNDRKRAKTSGHSIGVFWRCSSSIP